MLLQIVFKSQLWFGGLTEIFWNELCLDGVHQWNEELLLLKKILEHWVLQCSQKWATSTVSEETALSSFVLTGDSRIAHTHCHTYSLGYLLRIDYMGNPDLSEAQRRKIDLNSQQTTKEDGALTTPLKTSK